jgi:G patch domain-containing protein 1
MDFLTSTQATEHDPSAEYVLSSNHPTLNSPLLLSPISLSLQASLLPTPKSSIGAKILQKMGWRTGQGIGPRISLARRRAQDAQAYDPHTGARLASGSLTTPAEEDEDEEAKKHLYAQRDTPVLSVQRKDNPHGLGYVPGTTLHSSRPASGPKLAGSFILYSTYSSLR